MVQRVNMGYSLWDSPSREANISEDPTSGTLVDRLEWLANVVSKISLVVGFSAPLVKVATRICGRNVKALVDYGSMGNYI